MTKSNDCPIKSNSAPALADATLMLKLLEELDLEPDPAAAFMMASPALTAVATARATRSKKQLMPSQKQSAKDERLTYKINKEAGLGELRAYNRNAIEPRRLHGGNFETEEEYLRRYKREWARLKRGVTAEDIEAREYEREITTPATKMRKKADSEKARRASMTQDQKGADAARKRRKRAEAKLRSTVEADALTAAQKIS